MKKTFLVVFLSLINLSLFAQIQNIENLSTGIFYDRTVLTDGENEPIGHALIFNKGLIEDGAKIQYEYVLLDNNLNKITNGDFEFINFDKINFVLRSTLFYKQKLYLTSTFINRSITATYGELVTVIDLNNSKVESHKYFNQDEIYEFENISDFEEKIQVNNLLYFPFLRLHPLDGEMYFTHEKRSIYNQPSLTREVAAYTPKFDKTFEFTFGTRKERNDFIVEDITDNKLTILKSDLINRNRSEDRLITFDIKTGKELLNVAYNDRTASVSTYAMPFAEYINNQLMVVGEVKAFKPLFSEDLPYRPSFGIRRSIYNENGEVILDKITRYRDIFEEYGFVDGRDKKRYRYSLREWFNFDDASFAVLLEKQKGDNLGRVVRTSDYVLVSFDSAGEYISHHVLERDRMRQFDSYLFSQVNKQENEVLFFYADIVRENRQRKAFLTVNKLKNGELTQEILPYETESSYMRFSKTKYGYILISEYDKEEKESYIRLEKLNI